MQAPERLDATMALTDVAIRKAKPGPKPVKLADGGGMHLLITPAGANWLCVPVRAHPPHERKHNQRRSAAAGLCHR